MGGEAPKDRRNQAAETELERLKDDLLERIDDADDGPTTGDAGASLADQCDENPESLDEDESFGFNLANHLKDNEQ
jgi:hypothetical protein